MTPGMPWCKCVSFKAPITFAFVLTLAVCGLLILWSTTEHWPGDHLTRWGWISKEPPLKTILFLYKFHGASWTYNFGLGRDPFIAHNCSVNTCRTTTSRTEDPGSADAVVIHMGLGVDPTSPDAIPRRSRQGQKYVFLSFEAPKRAARDLQLYGDIFNLTFTYLNDPETDVYIPLGRIVRNPPNQYVRNTVPTTTQVAAKSKMAAWLVSNCRVSSQRNNYVASLSKFVSVDVYGACGNLSCPKSKECYNMIADTYKFYLAFENTMCIDYVTEKAFRPLEYPIIPVVLGLANYRKYMPPHSYIDVSDFGSPRHLAGYLKYLDENVTAYLEYFDWKKSPKSKVERIQVIRPEGFCKLCEILHDPHYKYKTRFDVYQYWVQGGNCITGPRERRILGLT